MMEETGRPPALLTEPTPMTLAPLKSRPKAPPDPGSVEARTLAIGRELFTDIGRGPSILNRGWWDDRMMGLTLTDPAVKIQLFRFIDALPALTTPEAVVGHLAEYVHQVGDGVPRWLRAAVDLAPARTFRGEILAAAARSGAGHMARRFIAGSTPTEAFRAVHALRRRGLAFTADLLGEAVISEAEADAYQATCLGLLRGLAGPLELEPEVPQIDRDDLGPIPRANLSLKLTSLTTHFDALHPEDTARRVLDRFRPILRTAREVGAFVNVDMEQFVHKDLTFTIFRQVLDEPEFRDWPDVGIVAQAYLRDTETDLATLAEWVGRRGTPVTVRLVKGAYWDYEVTQARQVGWPVPVHLDKWRTDACYERCARFLLEHRERLRPAFGSHNVRSLAHAMACAEALGVPASGFEVQMLHGMGEPIQRGAWSAEGCGSGSTRHTGLYCRGWRTSSAGCWRIRRTSRSSRLASPTGRRWKGSCGTPRRSEPCGSVDPRSSRGGSPASCRRSAMSRRPTSRGMRTATRCAGRSTTSGRGSAGRTRSGSAGGTWALGRTGPATRRSTHASARVSSAGRPGGWSRTRRTR